MFVWCVSLLDPIKFDWLYFNEYLFQKTHSKWKYNVWKFNNDQMKNRNEIFESETIIGYESKLTY